MPGSLGRQPGRRRRASSDGRMLAPEEAKPGRPGHARHRYSAATLSSNREPMGPASKRLPPAERRGVIHPIPVPFMEHRELRKGWIARRFAVDL